MFNPCMTSTLHHANRAYDFYRERNIGAAVEQFRLGAAAGEDPNEAALERWLSFMLAGDFESAWQESDRVLCNRKRSGEDCTHLPQHQRWLWDGTPLAGRNVMVRCFHGLGDTIQFIRFLPQLREICGEVSILPQAELRELVPPMLAGVPELEIELMEVPHALRLTLDEIPARVPYLQVAGSRPRNPAKFRVGLAWASGVWRPERSVPLELFRFLNDIPDMELVGLQRGPDALQLSSGIPACSPVFHEAEWWNDSIAETARIIRSLDLVISTDTMVAHLAGALAVPVWTLLQWDADWRWLHSRDDSPWYPTMRLFRQQKPGYWAGVIARIEQALREQLAPSTPVRNDCAGLAVP